MRNLSKRLIAGGFAAAIVASAAAPALAFPVQSVDPWTLSPAQRAIALNAPLGNYGPFGTPTQAGCRWSRIQVPTTSGLHWIDIESCRS